MIRLCLFLLIGVSVFLMSCSEQATEQVPEAGHTALGTSAPPTINPVRTDSLQYLSEYVGQSPDSANLWETEPLRSKLEELLGNDFDKFLQRMHHAGPLQEERVLYTINQQTNHNYLTFLLIDIETNQLHVSIIEDSIRYQYQTSGEDIYLPAEVEQIL